MAMSAETKPKTRENIRPPQSGSPQRAIAPRIIMAGGRRLFCDRLFGRPPSGAMLLQIELGSNASDPVLKKTIFLHPLFEARPKNGERATRSGLEIGQAAQEPPERGAPSETHVFDSKPKCSAKADSGLPSLRAAPVPCPRHEASIVSGFRLASRARSLLSALT